MGHALCGTSRLHRPAALLHSAILGVPPPLWQVPFVCIVPPIAACRPSAHLLPFSRVRVQVFLIVAIRVAYYVPLPCFSGLKQAKGSNVLDLFVPIEFGEFAAMFGGLSICHMGISPYISSSIFMAFLFAGVPSLREWRKDQGASGVDVMTQTTRKVGLLVSVGQALYTAMQLRPIAPPALQALPVMARAPSVANPPSAASFCAVRISHPCPLLAL